MRLSQALEGPTWLELTADSDALTITLSGMKEDSWGPYADWAALCAAWPHVFEAVCEPYGGPDNLYTNEEPSRPMDLDHALALAQRRSAPRDTAAYDDLLAKVAALLSAPHVEAAVKKTIPKRYRRDVDASPAGLTETFEFVLQLVPSPNTPVPVGGSKRGGSPDLPPGVPWPEVDDDRTVLLLQLNLSDLAPRDVTHRIPTTGVFQLFANASGQGVVLLHPTPEGLVRHPPVSPPDGFAEEPLEETALTTRAGYYFHTGTDLSCPVEVARALPPDTREALQALLGGGPLDAYDADRVLGGEPVDWQGMGASHVQGELFCQVNFGAGHVSVGWDLNDRMAGLIDEVDVEWCGT